MSYFLHMSDYTQINLVFQYVLWIHNASIENGELSEKKKNGIFLIFYSEKERKNRKNLKSHRQRFLFYDYPCSRTDIRLTAKPLPGFSPVLHAYTSSSSFLPVWVY
ncbi:hypothetical protein DQQ01_02180 [Blautia argi]|uniref:Uncharacterized protein n=1 Tax=Blautia argi TaxID=1912897 RepID=A0A2Z4U8E7_9FIRM|nr:hypothetical protein DQQ01_02180 [Blautia argi]